MLKQYEIKIKFKSKFGPKYFHFRPEKHETRLQAFNDSKFGWKILWLVFKSFNNFVRSAKSQFSRNIYYIIKIIILFSNILKNIRLKYKFMRFYTILGRFEHCKITFLVKFWIDECLRVQMKTLIKQCFYFMNLITYINLITQINCYLYNYIPAIV